MGFLKRFKKKEDKAPFSSETTVSSEEQSKRLNLAQAVRHLEIMHDSMNLVHKTICPKTFFSRYHMAIQEAQTVLQLCGADENGVDAENLLSDFSNNKVQIFNDFLERCSTAGKLHFVKDEITNHCQIIPQESYSYFLELLNHQKDETGDDDYIFYSVVFTEGGKPYYYLSDNQELRCGDHVTVPVGTNNEKVTGLIVKIEIYKGNQAPVPVNKLKYIMKD